MKARKISVRTFSSRSLKRPTRVGATDPYSSNSRSLRVLTTASKHFTEERRTFQLMSSSSLYSSSDPGEVTVGLARNQVEGKNKYCCHDYSCKMTEEYRYETTIHSCLLNITISEHVKGDTLVVIFNLHGLIFIFFSIIVVVGVIRNVLQTKFDDCGDMT